MSNSTWSNSPGTSLASATLSSPTITGVVDESGATRIIGAPRVLARWGVPCILASSGTMGNNGAVSGMTALATTYSNGAWLYLPAGAVAAGVPASATFVWFVASSTTAGTVYNSTWDGTGIPALGVTTAYSTTGPGAFTGISAGEILAATVTIAANEVGLSGRIITGAAMIANGTAGTKTPRIRYSAIGGTVVASNGVTTEGGYTYDAEIQARGVATAQIAIAKFHANNSSAGLQVTYPTATTTAQTTLVYTLQKAVATDHVVWEGGYASIIYGP